MRIAEVSRQALALALSGAIVLSVQFSTMAEAKMLSTESVIAKYGENTQRDFLLSNLARDDIRSQLIELGVDPAEAESRLAALSDREIRSMLAQFEAENAGGEAILSTLLTLFVILLVTDFLCLTRIFKFTRCI
jgi:hypothetical protein